MGLNEGCHIILGDKRAVNVDIHKALGLTGNNIVHDLHGGFCQ
jgi:hypothetical protein